MGVDPLPEEAPVIAELEAAGFAVEVDEVGWGYYHLSDQALQLVPQLLTIAFLDLFESCEAGETTDAGLASLTGNTSLRVLRLGPGITDAGLAHLAGLTQLRRLRLDSAGGITDAGMGSLRNLTRLEGLSLQYTRVGDAGVAALAELPSLTELELEGTLITDGAVRSLTAHRHLRLLTVGGTRISQAGFREVQQALPGCQVTGF